MQTMERVLEESRGTEREKLPEIIAVARDRLEIRDLEIDDLAAVYHLGERLFTRADRPILYRTWDAFEVTSCFNSDPEFCLVAQVGDGPILGFVLATTYERGGGAWKYGYVSWIGVDPQARRTRIGERLYRMVERRMKDQGIRMILLDTEASNQPALAFFKHLGFSSRARHLWLGKTLRSPGKRP